MREIHSGHVGGPSSNQPTLVSLVGAGPGDPGLLTLKGRDRIAQADVVVFDRLVHPEVLDHARPGARRIFVGKERGRQALDQAGINDLLVELARAGHRVVRLKGGDPFLFGRGGEEASALAAAGIDFEVVPGISSGIAAPAYAGIPVTDRRFSSSVTFVTGHEDPATSRVDWAGLARSVDTIVIFMGMKHLSKIADELVAGGRSPEVPVAIVQWGTHDDQQTVTGTLQNIVARAKAAHVGSPATIVIGEVVQLADSLAWFRGLEEAAELAV